MFVERPIDRLESGSPRAVLLCGDGSGLPALEAWRGQVQCVCMDPPFLTGGVYHRTRPCGEAGWRDGKPTLRLKGYADRYPNRAAYEAFLRGLLGQAKDLLTDSGVCYLHLDWHAAALGRMIGDEVFGERHFLNEIIWAYETGGRAKRTFSRKHDNILLWAKTRDYRLELARVSQPRAELRRNHMRAGVDEHGRTYRAIRSGGKEYRYYDDEPVVLGDVWTDIPHLQQRDPERTGLATQKPLKLLDRLLRPAVNAGDWVADLTCGSGSTLHAAQKLGCKVLGVDTNPQMLQLARHRLKAGHTLLVAPPCAEPGALEGSYDPASGELRLDAYRGGGALPAGLPGIEALESWDAGYIADGALQCRHTFRRSHTYPALEHRVQLPFRADAPVAVSTVDAAGDRRVWVWQED